MPGLMRVRRQSEKKYLGSHVRSRTGEHCSYTCRGQRNNESGNMVGHHSY